MKPLSDYDHLRHINPSVAGWYFGSYVSDNWGKELMLTFDQFGPESCQMLNLIRIIFEDFEKSAELEAALDECSSEIDLRREELHAEYINGLARDYA